MADFTIEAKRVKTGQALTDMNNQAVSAINQLKNIKINLAALKTTVGSDSDYTEDDVAAVQTVIEALQTELATI